MKGLKEEIFEIPKRAEECYKKNKGIALPLGVPYVGMGSSYYAPLTLYYCGSYIFPQIASEFYYYLTPEILSEGVLISQSGESSETVWALEKFKEVTSIVNNINSSLVKTDNLKESFQMHAGKESFSSTKSYINTLITLYLGLGFDPKIALESLNMNFEKWDKDMQKVSKILANQIKSGLINKFFVIGSGPNMATAMQSALVLSETTKLPWQALSVAQYDHGPKETADGSVVIILDSNGRDKKRIESVKKIIGKSAQIISIEEKQIEEIFSPITLFTQLSLLMNYVADELEVGDTFKYGGKVTLVEKGIK